MKKRVFTVVSVVAGLLFAGVLFADNDMALLQNAKSDINGVIQAIENSKLTNVKSIEFDDGQWEVKTLNNNIESKYIHTEQGKAAVTTAPPAVKQTNSAADKAVAKVQTNINNKQSQKKVAIGTSVPSQTAPSLTLVKQETENDLVPPAELNSLKSAIKAVQEKGYTVKSIDYEGTTWEVEGYGPKNLEYTILVNVEDGKIVPNTEKIDD